MTVLTDSTTTIRASVADVSVTLLVTVTLVIMVVALFMRRLVPTIAAGVHRAAVDCRHACRDVV